MQRLHRNTLIVLLTLVAVGAVLWAMLPSEPSYQGRPLTDWLEDLDVSIKLRLPREKLQILMAEKQRNREAAEKAVRLIGTNALPTLTKMLGSKDSKLKQNLVVWTSKLPFVRLHVRPASEQRFLADEAFKVLGSEAEPGIPALLEMLEDRDEVEVPVTTEALVAIGAKVIPPLARALTNQNARIQMAAIDVLGDPGLAPHTTAAIPELVKCLSAKSAGVRYAAAGALGNIGAEPAVVVPALVDKLSDTNFKVRINCVIALGKFGNAAKLAVPDLLRTLSDANASVRNAAAESLKQIDPEAAVNAGIK